MDEDLDLELSFLPAEQKTIAHRTLAVARARMRVHGLPDPESYRAGMVVGMLLDTPPPDATIGRCKECGASVQIGPESQRLIRQRPELPVVCGVCAILAGAALKAAGAGLDVVQASKYRRPAGP